MIKKVLLGVRAVESLTPEVFSEHLDVVLRDMV